MTVLRSGSATDVGRVRTVNQDMVLEQANLYAVADGMGGHVGGEVAARVAVETLGHVFERTPTVDGLREAFSEANAAVWQESQSNEDLRGMGTTLTAMGLVGGPEGRDVLALANVGDSRAYVYTDGELLQVTDDHSLAEERMRHGEMTEAEAAVHPQRHILTRVLGVFSEVEADMWELELHAGDRVLLCSDGLSNEVDTDEIAGVLDSVDDPREAAHRLVEVANQHGGSDNVTVVIVDVQVGEAESGGAARVRPLEFRAAAVSSAAAAVAAAATNGGAEAAGPDATEGGAATEPGSVTGAAAQTAAVPAVRPDDTLAPGARLGFGDEPLTLAETGPRSDEFFLGASTSVPVARATTRVPPVSPPAGRRRPTARQGEPRRPSPPARDSPARHATGGRFRLLGGGRPRGGVLRAQVVRLRQLDRDAPGRPDRGAAGPTRRCPLVPPAGGRPDAVYGERHLARCDRTCACRRAEVVARRRQGLRDEHHDHDHHPGHDDHHHDVTLRQAHGGAEPVCGRHHHDHGGRLPMNNAPNPRRQVHPA